MHATRILFIWWLLHIIAAHTKSKIICLVSLLFRFEFFIILTCTMCPMVVTAGYNTIHTHTCIYPLGNIACYRAIAITHQDITHHIAFRIVSSKNSNNHNTKKKRNRKQINTNKTNGFSSFVLLHLSYIESIWSNSNNLMVKYVKKMVKKTALYALQIHQ